MDIRKRLTLLLEEVILNSDQFGRVKTLPPAKLEIPKNKAFGDFSCNLALNLAKQMGRPPLEIAQQIKDSLTRHPGYAQLAAKIAKIEVKGAGFLNFFLSKACLHQVVVEIAKQRDNFGRSDLGQGKTIHIEFVSANPTGPLNVAHGRQAAFGDTLARILQFCGYKVHREYYLNDQGVQIDLLGESLQAKYLQALGQKAEFPESGYRGKYVDDLAAQLLQKYGRRLTKGSAGLKQRLANFAYQKILKQIKEHLRSFSVPFDSWFSQRRLNRSGHINRALKQLKKKGYLYAQDGAWWLATSRFGDDKDRVVIKSDSKLTYLAPDIAYHQNKFKRNFSRMINIWGPDHHGYIPRIKAAVAALGYDAQRISFLIVQLVSLARADQIIPMSTRMGQYVSLADIIQAVGKDAARFFFLMRNRDAHLHFDLELAKKQSLENPVYYVQYAHARCLNILKFSTTRPTPIAKLNKKLDLSLLSQPEELALIQRLNRFSEVVLACARNLEPHRLTIYLQDLAKDLHHYYEKHRVVTNQKPLSQARLALIDATRIVLRNALGLLAIEAVEKM